MIRVLHGDCREILPTLGEPFHACVCDPPYHLTAGKKGGTGIASLNLSSPAGRARVTTGFMNQGWDGGDIAFRPETWRLVFDALLPGAYLVAFGGTRTYHRMVCAIEDAGFEIRDSLSYLYDGGLPGPFLWCFGSGFPKNLNVSGQLNEHRCRCKAAGAAPKHRPSHDMSGLRRGMDGENPLSGGEEQDVLADMQSGMAFATSDRKRTGGSVDTVREVRRSIPSSSITHSAQYPGVLQPVMPRETNLWSSLEQAQPQRAGGLDRSERGQSPSENDGAAKSGMEGRNHLPTSQGPLRERSLRPLSARADLHGPEGRLCDGAQAGNGPMDQAPVEPDGVRASPRPQTIEQCAQQSGAVADQSEPQGGGAWPLCDRCGKPIIPDGFGTALKPAVELICIARKPLSESTVAANFLKHGTGALHIDACRVPAQGRPLRERVAGEADSPGHAIYGDGLSSPAYATGTTDAGRWPANVLHSGDEQVEAAFAAFGTSTESPRLINRNGDRKMDGWGFAGKSIGVVRGDSGTASRFFQRCAFSPDELRFHYSAKADTADRADSRHATIKPVALLRWLVRLVTPPGGHILDPFAGSGTTGEAAMLEGFDCTLIEQDAKHVADIQHRIKRWSGGDTPLFKEAAE